MIKAPIPLNDYLRLQDLYDLEILDTAEEEDYTCIAKLASFICQMPIALISLMDSSREWFKARVGIDQLQVNRDISFCGHAIVQEESFFQVEDTLKDLRFSDNPLVIFFPYIRFYAGEQLISRNGFKIGMLCVQDTKPQSLTGEQVLALKVLARCVSILLDLRLRKKEEAEMSKKIQFLNEMKGKLLAMITNDMRPYQSHKKKGTK